MRVLWSVLFWLVCRTIHNLQTRARLSATERDGALILLFIEGSSLVGAARHSSCHMCDLSQQDCHCTYSSLIIIELRGSG